MSLVRTYERRNAAAGIVTAPVPVETTSRSHRPTHRVALPVPSATAAAPTPTIAASAPQPTSSRPRFKRLSPEELATKRASDKSVFLLELDEDQDVDAVVEELGISLHVLTGINVAGTMLLRVTIAGGPAQDSGSTHTFIRDSIARQLGLNVIPRPDLSVKRW